MSLPEAVAWLEEGAGSWSLSSQKVYARTILDEIVRLKGEVDMLSMEIERRESQRVESREEFLALGRERERLKEELVRLDEAFRSKFLSAEKSLEATQGKLNQAENLLRDIHYGLLKQPELTREELAAVITSLVDPYPEGARP